MTSEEVQALIDEIRSDGYVEGESSANYDDDLVLELCFQLLEARKFLGREQKVSRALAAKLQAVQAAMSQNTGGDE